MGHIIVRHNVNPRIRNDKVQSREACGPRLDKPHFKALPRFLRIPVVDELLQTLLSSLCRRNTKIVPDETREHPEEEIEESAEGECVESCFDASVEIGDQEAEIAL